MAQIELQGPTKPRQPFNTGDETPETGWWPKRIVDSLNTMFTEVFASLGSLDAAVALIEADIAHLSTIVELTGEGAPDASAKATANVNPTGDDNSLTFTAKAFGEDGNDISVVYVDPEENNVALGVELVGTEIMVTLATDSEGAITSTAADILAAIEAHAESDALVDVAIHTGDTGSGDDGSGVVTAMESVALEGGTGVGIGVATKGSRYTDITTPGLYINTGDEDEPVWVELVQAS